MRQYWSRAKNDPDHLLQHITTVLASIDGQPGARNLTMVWGQAIIGRGGRSKPIEMKKDPLTMIADGIDKAQTYIRSKVGLWSLFDACDVEEDLDPEEERNVEDMDYDDEDDEDDKNVDDVNDLLYRYYS
eukprot:TRINITY_DN8429_c0_g2_i3.p1 TRINITY_DN8429_c0_g2~~TRINITY_DN8429_c0_g2_i3.p1  ORF type:complete len:130 (-),score=30.86 TRINITY_DN8429_c0_g2_i3:32-421(-)